MSTLDERLSVEQRRLLLEHAKDVVAERAAASKSDELRSIGSFSVLSEPDRKIIETAGRWLRHMWLEATPGYSMKLDGIDHDSVYDAMRQVEGLLTRTLPEPALSRHRINPAEHAHAREIEDVCGTCGGRTINGTCLRHCDRD